MIAFDAIIVAGGRGSRLGGVRKPELRVGGRRLLDVALAAASGARARVVVGDVAVPGGVLLTGEDPPYGGPVAGVEAGFAALGSHAPHTLLLAADLPDAEAAVAELLAAASSPEAQAADGVCLRDAGGRLQWLLGVYRTDALAARLVARASEGFTAMYRLLEPLALVGVAPSAASVADVDTPEDAARWGAKEDA